jgi:hypothetical protein
MLTPHWDDYLRSSCDLTAFQERRSDCFNSQAHSANKPPPTTSSSETGKGLLCPAWGSVKVPRGVVPGDETGVVDVLGDIAVGVSDGGGAGPINVGVTVGVSVGGVSVGVLLGVSVMVGGGALVGVIEGVSVMLNVVA